MKNAFNRPTPEDTMANWIKHLSTCRQCLAIKSLTATGKLPTRGRRPFCATDRAYNNAWNHAMDRALLTAAPRKASS